MRPETAAERRLGERLGIVTAFLAWWWEQLRSLLPARLRVDRTRIRDAVIARSMTPPSAMGVITEASGGAAPAIELFSRRGGRVSPAGVIDAASPAAAARHRLPCLLRADPAALLERDLSLPLAAERDLDGVLGFELERLTPFAASELIWSWRVIGRDRARGRLAVRLSMIPLAPFRRAIEALAVAGLPVTAIEVAPADDLSPGTTLLPLAHAAPVGGPWQRHLRSAGFALALALAILVVALPFMRQSEALDALAQTETLLRPRVEAAAALRKRLAGLGKGTDIVASQLARGGDPLVALQAVTDILPDDTWLTTLTLSQRKLVMEGRSAAAARLIGALSAGPVIRDAAFAAPVTRDDATGTDLFSIQASFQAGIGKDTVRNGGKDAAKDGVREVAR